MNPTKLFPLIVTEKLDETRAFYTEQAGFTATIDRDGYLQVRYGDDEGAPELCFMQRSDDGPIGPTRAFEGNGLIMSIPTDDADQKYGHLERRGVELLAEPSDKPWGWRSFIAVDPNGMLLDFFHVCAQSAVADAAS